MDSSIALYESQVCAITDVCADPWFSRQLAAHRGGDEFAWRLISGSCLHQVLNIAKQKWRRESSLGLLELVQEGNVVLVRTIRIFKGNTAAEFLGELTKQVESRLTLLLEHPDLLN